MAVALLILLTPFFTFFHLLADYDSNIFTFFDLSIDHGFPNNQVFVWVIISHIIYYLYFLMLFLFATGFWRTFLLPILFHWIAYPFWLFNSSLKNYFEYLIGDDSIIILILVILTTLLLEIYIALHYHQNQIKLTSGYYWREIFTSRNSRFNREIGKTINNRSKFTLKEYVCRIYHYRLLFYKDSSMLVKAEEVPDGKFRLNENLFLSLFICVLALLLIIHHIIPSGLEKVTFLGIQISSFGFLDISTFVFYVSQKFVLLCVVIIWFITSNNWWRWAILSPIFFFSYQFWESFQDTLFLESYGNLRVLPLVLLTMLGVFLLSKVIRRVSINLDYQAYLEEELDKSLGELSRERSESRSVAS